MNILSKLAPIMHTWTYTTPTPTAQQQQPKTTNANISKHKMFASRDLFRRREETRFPTTKHDLSIYEVQLCDVAKAAQTKSIQHSQHRVDFITLRYRNSESSNVCVFFSKVCTALNGLCDLSIQFALTLSPYGAPIIVWRGGGGEGEGCCSVFVYMMLGFAVIEAPSGSMDLAGGSVIRSAN